jgi:SAM-dependent methyltransferase
VPLLRPKQPARSQQAIRAHYEIERPLADRLRAAPPEQRMRLYGEVYDELFRTVPDAQQLALKENPEFRRHRVERHLNWLEPYLGPDRTYLEIGAGDCALTLAVAPHVRRAIACEISEEIVSGVDGPANFEVVLSDGRSVPVPEGSVDVAFSDQMMEHLHPDDAYDQLANVFRALAPGGIYMCNTPNRLSGPHDISKGFDEEATCLHLKEYTSRELADLFRKAGFSRVQTFTVLGPLRVVLPVGFAHAIEGVLARLGRPGRAIARGGLGRRALGNRIVGTR